MYSFHSQVDKSTIDDNYKRIFCRAGLQQKWNRELIACPELAQTLPVGKTPEDMLTMNYEDLVDVYLNYQKVYHSLIPARQQVLKDASNKIFTYDTYSKRIGQFLIEKSNGFEINNCVYCDLSDATSVDDKRQFMTEHILDKGECPLVGLSLYNFCPACFFCNTTCKGSHPIGAGSAQMKKLGPTSQLYDFEHKVRFVLTGSHNALGRIKVDHPEWYNLEFKYLDNDYKQVVIMFKLVERYNIEKNKLQAIEWRKLAQKNRGIALALAALIHGSSIDDEVKKVFNYEKHKKAHSLMLKLMEDMMV